MSLPTAFSGATSAAPSAPVQAVGTAVMGVAAEGLARAFDAADEALFDLSCRAGNDQGQSRYFDGMRQLRLGRESILETFRETVLAGWRLQTGMRAGGARQAASPEGLSLDLVSEEELEERLAVDGIVARCESGMGHSLADLQKALNANLGRGMDVSDCAIGPRGLCDSVREACAQVSLSLNVRLVVLQCFEAQAMPRLPDVYSRVAALLSTARVAAPNAPGATSQTRGADVQRPVASVENRVPTPLRPAAVPPAGPASIAARAGPKPSAPASTAKPFDRPGTQQTGSTQRHSPAASATDTRAKASVAAADAIQRIMQDAGMALDLAPELETALRRLEVPLVRLAIADPQMLKDSGHPARMFIAELAGWTRRWGRHPPTDAMLLDRLGKFHALTKDDLNAQIEFFEREAAFMARAASNQLRRAQLAEQRAREAERGKARLREAEAEVAELMADWPDLLHLPAPLADMALGRWPRYLVLMRLRGARGSPEWREAVAVLDDLSAAVQGRGPRSVDAVVLAKGVIATGGHVDEVDQCVRVLSSMRPLAPARPPTRGVAPEQTPAVRGPEDNSGIDHLRPGRSFTLLQQDGHACRVKLAWIGQQGRRFLFVDRNGLKYAEFAREEVEALSATGKLREDDSSDGLSAGAA